MTILATLNIIRYNKIIKTRSWFNCRLWLFYFYVVIKKCGYSFFGLWILSPSTGQKVLVVLGFNQFDWNSINDSLLRLSQSIYDTCTDCNFNVKLYSMKHHLMLHNLMLHYACYVSVFLWMLKHFLSSGMWLISRGPSVCWYIRCWNSMKELITNKTNPKIYRYKQQ